MLAAANAAKSPQSCLTLCDPIDGSPPGSPVLGILQARTLEWVAICLVVSNSLRPHALYPTRLLHPWDSPGKILEWATNSSSRGSSLPRDQTHVSCGFCIGRQTITELPGRPHKQETGTEGGTRKAFLPGSPAGSCSISLRFDYSLSPLNFPCRYVNLSEYVCNSYGCISYFL